MMIDQNERTDKSAKPTNRISYFETLLHVVRGNIGSGLFAMPFAFQHAGLLAGPILTVLIGSLSLYNNHVLVRCSDYIKDRKKIEVELDFPQTIEMCFESGPVIFRRWKAFVRESVKVFILTTQLGACAVYFIFVSTTGQQLLDSYGVHWDRRIVMLIMLVIVLPICYMPSLKYLFPFSFGCNVVMAVAIVLTIYMICQSLPSTLPVDHLVSSVLDMPIFLGTVLYSFEGICFALPFRNEMRNPKLYTHPLGVLNVGIFIITLLFVIMGFLGYWAFGDATKDAIVLNLGNSTLPQVIQIALVVVTLFSYPLQFYLVGHYVWCDLNKYFGPFGRPRLVQIVMKTCLILFTFGLGAVFPSLGLILSLFGAVNCTSLAYFYPALCDIAIRCSPPESKPLRTKHHKWRLFWDGVTIFVSIVVLPTGAYCSIRDIINSFH